MAQTTWDVSRQGGGTYEFEQDAQGNYNLKTVGFDKLNKLNLPELKKETATSTIGTDTTKAIATVGAQTAKAFGDVRPTYDTGGGGSGGGPDNQYTMRKEGDLSTEIKPMTTGDATLPPQLGGSSTLEQAKQFQTAGKSTQKDTIPKWAEGVDTRGYENLRQQDKSRAWDQGEWGPKPSNVYRSETEKFKTRFDPTQIKAAAEKPKAAEVVSTQLKKVKTALSPLARSVGFVMGPIKGMMGTVAGMVKETPELKHNNKYFNVNDRGRVAGNASTDLYAGMNRTSAFGNLEKAGEKRINTREKNISKKGYGPGDKFYDDTQKMKEQQKDYKSSLDNVVEKGYTRTRAERKANPGRKDANTMSGGSDSGGGGRVICTELHRTHELSTKDWIRDVQFTFKKLTKNHIKGYLIWAMPTVKHIQKYPKYRKIWKHIAQHRANDIAWRLNEGNFDLLGRIYAGIGEPLCWLIGNFVNDTQYNELNLKNWRRA